MKQVTKTKIDKNEIKSYLRLDIIVVEIDF